LAGSQVCCKVSACGKGQLKITKVYNITPVKFAKTVFGLTMVLTKHVKAITGTKIKTN